MTEYRFGPTGAQFEGISKHHAQMPAQVPGEHLWVVIPMYRINPAVNQRAILDMENLLSIEGPCCYWCEQPYSEGLAARKCEATP